MMETSSIALILWKQSKGGAKSLFALTLSLASSSFRQCCLGLSLKAHRSSGEQEVWKLRGSLGGRFHALGCMD